VQRTVIRRDVADDEGRAVEMRDQWPGRVETHRRLALPTGLQQDVDRSGRVCHPDDRPRPIRHAEDDVAPLTIRETANARG